MRMRQETFKKSYYIPAFGKSIEIRRNQDIDKDGILGKELLAQYGEDCILEGETKSLIEKIASGDIGGSGTSLTTEQTAALEKIEGLVVSASEIDNKVKYLGENRGMIKFDSSLATVTIIPTIATVYNNSAYKKYSIWNNVDCFQESGYLTKINYAGYANYVNSKVFKGNLGTSGSAIKMNIKFCTDASIIYLGMGGTHSFGVKIDGVVLKKGKYLMASDNQNMGFASIDFGTQAIREVEISFNSALGFHGIWVPKAYTVWSPKKYSPRVTYVGDSFGTQTTSDIPFCFYQDMIDNEMGWFNTNLTAVGGTGFANPGAVGLTYISRFQDVIDFNTEILVVSGSVNDSAKTEAEMVAAVQLFLTTAKNYLGNKPIIVLGVPGKDDTYSQNIETYMQTAINGLNYDNVFFLPCHINGTPLLNSDNVSRYISDGTHYTTDGYIAWGTFMAKKVRAALESLN